MQTHTESLLRVSDLSFKPYKNVSFHNISLNIQEGKVIGLLGKNGAGKSTLLMKLAGFGEKVEGKILINGIDLYSSPVSARNYISCVLDATKFYPFLTGIKNLHIFNGKNNVHVQENIDHFQMNSHINKKVKKYSLGMYQKLKLISALNQQKKLILLDEPTNGLDLQSILAFEKRIIELRQAGVTIIISSHHINDLKAYCTDFLLLHNGRLSKVEPAEEHIFDIKVKNTDEAKRVLALLPSLKFIPNQEKEYVSISLEAKDEISRVIEVLVDQNIKIEEVNKKNVIEFDFLKETR